MILAEKIKSITRKHLTENNGVFLSQNVSAVGYIAGTVPDDIPNNQNIIELPTSDCSNSGIVCGYGLMGRRPIYCIRFAPLGWFNYCHLVNYACKSKYMWNVSCPIFVRVLSSESSIGPVCSGSCHSMLLRVPGATVVAPTTPCEYEEIWDFFTQNEGVIFVSESRKCLTVDYEMETKITNTADVTIIAISTARLNAIQVVKNLQENQISCNLVHLVWLKPLIFPDGIVAAVRNSKLSIVIDSDFEMCGASQFVAYSLTMKAGKPVFAYGLKDKTHGFSNQTDNILTTSEITEYVKQTINNMP